MRRILYLFLNILLFVGLKAAQTEEQELVQAFESAQECVCEKGEKECSCERGAKGKFVGMQKEVTISKEYLIRRLKAATLKAAKAKKMLKKIDRVIKKETKKSVIIHSKVVKMMRAQKKIQAKAISAKVQVDTLAKATTIMKTPFSKLSSKSVKRMIVNAAKKTQQNEKRLAILKLEAKKTNKQLLKTPSKEKPIVLGKLKKTYNEIAAIKGKIIAQKKIIQVLKGTHAKVSLKEKLKEVKKLKENIFLSKFGVIKKQHKKKLPAKVPVTVPSPPKKPAKVKISPGIIKKAAHKPVYVIKKAALQFTILKKAEKEVKKATIELKTAPIAKKPLLEKKLKETKKRVAVLKKIAFRTLKEATVKSSAFAKRVLNPIQNLKAKLLKHQEEINKSKAYLQTVIDKKFPPVAINLQIIKIKKQKKAAKKLASKITKLGCAAKLAGLKVFNAKIKLLKQVITNSCSKVLKAKVEIPEKKLIIQKQLLQRQKKKLQKILIKLKKVKSAHKKKILITKKKIKIAKLAVANKKVAKAILKLEIAKKKVEAIRKLIDIKKKIINLKKLSKMVKPKKQARIASTIKNLVERAKLVVKKIKTEVKQNKIAVKKLVKQIKQNKKVVSVLKLKEKALKKTMPKAPKVAKATVAKIVKLNKMIKKAEPKVMKALIEKKKFQKKKLGIALKQGKKAVIKRRSSITLAKAAKLIVSINKNIAKLQEISKTAPPAEKVKIQAKISKLKETANIVKERAKTKLANNIITVKKLNKSIHKDVASIAKKPIVPLKPAQKKLVKKVIKKEKENARKMFIDNTKKRVDLLKLKQIKAKETIAKTTAFADKRIPHLNEKIHGFKKLMKSMPAKKRAAIVDVIKNLNQEIQTIKTNTQIEVAKQQLIIKKANEDIKTAKLKMPLRPLKSGAKPTAVQKLAAKIEKLNQLIKTAPPQLKKGYILQKRIAKKQLQLVKIKLEKSQAMNKIGKILKQVVTLKSSIGKASPKEQEHMIDTIKLLKAKARNIVKKEAEKTAIKVIKKANKAKIPESVKKQKIAAKLHRKWAKAKLNIVNQKLLKVKSPAVRAVLLKKKASLEKKLGPPKTLSVNIPLVVKKLDRMNNKLNKRSIAVANLAHDSKLLHSTKVELD